MIQFSNVFENYEEFPIHFVVVDHTPARAVQDQL